MRRHFVLACALALGLAACGGSGTSPPTVTRTVTAPTSPTTTTSAATTTQTTTPTTTTATTTASATTTSASSATQACTAQDLTLTFIGQQGAAGHGEIAFALKNTSSAPCHTYGFPGIQFLAKDGSPLTTIPHHTTIDYFGHAPEAKLTIPPGGTVSFRLGVTHGAIPGSVCSTAYGLQVIPPDDTATVRAQIASGAYECRDATISPLQPGTTAFR